MSLWHGKRGAPIGPSSAAVTALLFTDIEGSSRLRESDTERMRPALAAHDALARSAVGERRTTPLSPTPTRGSRKRAP